MVSNLFLYGVTVQPGNSLPVCVARKQNPLSRKLQRIALFTFTDC